MRNRIAEAKSKKYLYKEIAEDLDGCRNARHGGIVAGGLE